MSTAIQIFFGGLILTIATSPGICACLHISDAQHGVYLITFVIYSHHLNITDFDIAFKMYKSLFKQMYSPVQLTLIVLNILHL